MTQKRHIHEQEILADDGFLETVIKVRSTESMATHPCSNPTCNLPENAHELLAHLSPCGLTVNQLELTYATLFGSLDSAWDVGIVSQANQYVESLQGEVQTERGLGGYL